MNENAKKLGHQGNNIRFFRVDWKLGKGALGEKIGISNNQVLKNIFIIAVVFLCSCVNTNTNKNTGSIMPKEVLDYIVDGDTIATFISKEYPTVYNLWTKDTINDVAIMDSIKSELSIDDKYTVFLYTDKRPNDNYYAYYNGKHIFMRSLPVKSSSKENIPTNTLTKKVNQGTQYCSGKELLAYNYAMDFVKKRLKSPSSAKFPPSSEKINHTKCDEYNCRYKINSWVDSDNSFGAKLRNNFSCYILFKDGEAFCDELKFE